jgi:type VI secretion system protein
MSLNHSTAAKLRMTVHGGDGAAPRSVEFDEAGGTLGRAPDCTLVLPDTQRAISRMQARIEWRDNMYFLIDAGSNPTLVNDRVLDGSRETQLHVGDRLRIGSYVLDVSIQEADRPENPLHETTMTRVTPEIPRPSAPLSDKPDWDVKPAAPLIPDDWNAPRETSPDSRADPPFFPDPLAATPLLREPARFGVDANQELIDALGAGDGLLGIGPQRRDVTPFSDSRSSQGFEYVSPERGMSAVPTLPPLNERALIPDDFDALITPMEMQERHDRVIREAEAKAGPQRTLEPDAKAVAQASPSLEVTIAPKPELKHAEPSNMASDPDATLTALLNGLGIDASTVRHIHAPDLARLVGGMLREATQGTMTALRARSMAKRETRIAMTLIEERDNNPLKFFPDVDMALTQMLGARGAGYLAPEDALRAAFRDIQAHELAVVAGMRAALEHAMARIDPATIEKSLDAATGLDALLGNRRARLWQRFVDTWEHVARDAGDDFQRTFGESFSRAYQAQLDALKN